MPATVGDSFQVKGGDAVGDRVEMELTPDEALVLFEFLSRFSDTDALTIEDQAEQRTLWNLLCKLESQLVEPFRPECRQLVQQARDRLRDKED